MPKPRMGESEQEFVDRCIPIVIEDGTAKDGSQGNAICHSMFSQHKKEVEEELKQRSDNVDQMFQTLMSSSGITSFSQLQDVTESSDVLDDVDAMTSMLGWMIFNIKHDESITDKEAAVSKAVDEFASMAKDYLSGKSETKTLFDQLKEKLGFKEAAFKTEAGKKFHASDYAFVPDPEKPSTWKLRLAETPGKVTVAQLGRAAAAFSSGGFRGNKVQGLGGKAGSVKAKIRAAYKKLGVKDEDIPDSIKEQNSITITKDANGNYRFLAIYSNNFRDDDNPPEIISAKSHKRFVDLVDAKEAPMPELWHWHIPGTCWGSADMVAFDEDEGFAIAEGSIAKGHEAEAEYIMAHPELDFRMSHGMPKMSIAYDPEDNSVITEHLTKEISVLPGWAAANKLTKFLVLDSEEKDMALPQAKKDYLKAMGYSDAQISSIETGTQSMGKEAQDRGVESKEKEGEVTNAPAAEATPAPEPKTEETPATPVTEEGKSKESDAPQYVTQSDFVEAVTAAIAINNKALLDQVRAMVEDQTKTMKEELETLKKESVTSVTPTASLASMIAERMSAVGNKEAQIRKDNPLAKSSPAETPSESAQSPVVTGNLVVDRIVPGLWNNGGK